MTKAKTAKKTDADVEEKAKAKKPKAKAAEVEAPKKAAAKPKAKAPAKEVKEVKETKTKAAEPKAKKKTETEAAPAAAAPAPAAPAPKQETPPENKISGRFTNNGLGVKVAKKPALSVAPGVMILGRPAEKKPEPDHKTSERKLSKKELGDIETFLLEKRERLLAGMRRELAMQRERAESKAADEVDKATDAYDEDLSFEIATANDQELEEFQVGLEKIERGTYGQCEICGCTISPSRLKILPSATTCVSCRGQEELARRRDDGTPNFNIAGNEDGELDSPEM